MCYRLLAGVWYLFAMLIIASYTANLAAFLTVETLERPIKSAEDLAHQTEIKYGVLGGGSTMRFFEKSTHATYKILWDFMKGNRKLKKSFQVMFVSGKPYTILYTYIADII